MSNSRHTLIRFWALDHHRAETVLWEATTWHALAYVLEGTMSVESLDQYHLLTPHRALAIAPGLPHPARTLGPAKVRTIYLAPEVSLPGGVRVLAVRPLLHELILEACRIGPLGTDGPVERALAELIVDEIRSAPSLPSSIAMPQTEGLRAWAQNYLDRPGTPPNPLGYSRRTTERRFRAETGVSLGRWTQQARALAGLRALSAGSTVLEASIAAGYETTSGFIQAFKRQFGTTPGRLLPG